MEGNIPIKSTRPLIIVLFFILAACVHPSGSSLPASQWQYFAKINGQIVIPIEINAVKAASLLDSGATGNLIDMKLAKGMHWPISHQKAFAEGFQSGSSVDFVESLKFSFAGIHVIAPAAVLTLQRESYESVLGLPFFENNVVELDFSTNKIRVLETSQFKPEVKYKKIPLSRGEQGVFFSAQVNGSPIQLLLDLGAAITIALPTDATHINDLRASNAREVQVRGISGNDIPLPYGSPIHLSIEESSFFQNDLKPLYFEHQIGERKEYGIVGLKFWQDYRIAIDITHDMLYFMSTEVEPSN